MNENRLLVLIRRFLDGSVYQHILALVCVGFAVYANAIFHPFVHDDVVFILQNPNIARWDNISDAFLRPAIPQFFEGLVTPYYRPILEVLYRLQYALFGFDAHGFHFVNVLVHSFNAGLVYLLIHKIIKSRSWAFLAALIFLVHPVQSQAVACVSGISNLACEFFLLAAFNGYVRWVQAEERAGSVRWQVIVIVGFLGALFSKEQAVVFPIICWLYEAWNADKKRSGLVLVRVAAVVLPFVFYLFVRHSLFGNFTSAIFENFGELQLRLLALAGTINMYAGLVFFPGGLHYYRSVDILAPFIHSWIILIVGLGILWMAVRSLQPENRRWACFGISWFVVALLPVLNIIPLVNEYSFLAAAEHNLYFPMVGLLIAFAAAARYWAQGISVDAQGRWLLAVVVIVVVMIVLTVAQNRVWRSELALFERAAQHEPQLGRVRILLAKAYFKEGRMDDALREFDVAARIMTDYTHKAVGEKAKRFYAGMLKGIYSDSAQACAAKRDFGSSLKRYGQAIAIDPKDSYLYSNRALSMIGAGDLNAGMADLQTALALDGKNLLAANNLSICYIQKGETAKAKELLEAILAKDPGFTPARDNLSRLQREQAIKP